MDDRFFSRRWARNYFKTCSQLPDIDIIENDIVSPAGQRSRQAYRRARWYLRRRRDQTRISLEVCSELGGPFTLLVNGEPLATVSLPPAEWKWFSVDLSGAPFDEAFVMEIRLEREPRQFPEGLSSVRRRRIGESGMKRLIGALNQSCRVPRL